MKSYVNSLILVCLITLASAGTAQQAAASPRESVPTGDANEPAATSFPYIAEITGDNVNIRSGPGTNYYSCGKLNKTDKVKIVGRQFGWSRIAPPPSSFSWISTQYVTVNPDNPSVGTVTGDDVRVYAGSDEVRPIHSTTLQGKLNKGDKVELTGQQQDDYYKIASPSFAYLWVLTDYTKPLGPVGEVPLAAEPQPAPAAESPAVVPTNIPLEAEKLKEYYALQKQIDSERAKPLDQQDYADIKKPLSDIAAVKEAGKAARYAEFTLKQIERCELAGQIDKEVRLQDKQLQQIKKNIETARATQLAEVPDLGRFAVIGKFYTSNIYGTQAELRHYLITDNSGKIICYGLPTGPAIKLDLSEFIDHKVGLVGSIEPHPQTSGALVKFEEIVRLE
jgi:uncharacterized protein YgiM (DUF1202 family)